MDLSQSTLVIAGSSGYVGRHLVQKIRTRAHVIGLSRSQQKPKQGVEYRSCDLFSLLDAERGVAGADYAIYLVHSMLPSARLTQGGFADFDLIAADNFARACAKQGVKHIVYLSGLTPDSGELSEHLKSRKEVEMTLRSYGVPVTILRASLIIGADGSSFVMLLNLVKRLPIMICPEWTRRLTQPIGLDDVLALLEFCVGRREVFDQTYDIGGPDILTYEQMIIRVAHALGREPDLVRVPFVSLRLSSYWVSLLAGAPLELVRPLIETLQHEMICRDRRLQDMAGVSGQSFDHALAKALSHRNESQRLPLAFRRHRSHFSVSDVRSVQRLPLPPGRDAQWVAFEYQRTLPQLVFWIVRVETTSDGVCYFYLRPFSLLLLQLTRSQTRSHPDRQLFYITGGVLTQPIGRGRLEFREACGSTVILAAIHEFRPRLPWLIYTFTQALFHLYVMRQFRRHLARISRAPSVAQVAPSLPEMG